jgi:cell division septum initiation protein DivIVA
MYNLLQSNQELQQSVQRLEAELQQRILSESSSSRRVVQPHNDSKQVCEK